MNPSSHPTAAIAVINGTVYTEKVSHASTVVDCPMEKAMRFVEKYTKRPRETWEHIPGHPFVLAADALAKRMVGIDDRPKPYVGGGTRQARPPRGKNKPLPFTEN